MSTMREEFEAVFRESFKSDADFAGDEWSYHDLSVDNAWDLWSAAYAAGQKADTALLKQALEALEHCADWLPEDSSARMGAISVIDDLVAAIRARDKEQG